MTDEITIKDLQLRTIIGITEYERHDRQDILVNLTLFVDTRAAGRSDSIDDAPVNYRTVTKKIIALVEGSSFCLIERLAEKIADLCLTEPKVARVRVSVDKPGALRFARTVGVTIDRKRDDG